MTEATGMQGPTLNAPVLGRIGATVLAILPFAYVVGYYSWAITNLNYGLGWVPTTPDRYLALGFLALLLGFELWMVAVAPNLRLRKIGTKPPFFAWLHFPILGATFVLLYVIALQRFQVLGQLPLAIWWYGVIGAGLGILSVFLRPFFSQKRPAGGAAVLAIALFMAALLFPAAFAGAVQSSFGGTAPSQAILELDRAAVSPFVRGVLGYNTTGNVVITRELWVFPSATDSWLVRLAVDSENRLHSPYDGYLLEIPKTSVMTVTWLSR